MHRTFVALAGLLLVATFAPLAAQPLPGTKPLMYNRDLAEDMVDGIDNFLYNETRESIEHRCKTWKPDFTSPEKYTASLAPQRRKLARLIGAADTRTAPPVMELIATTEHGATVGQAENYTVLAVRWPVLRGIYSEGLLLEPKGKIVADVVALPDADHTPEMLVGLIPGVPAGSQFARRLAESGCRVLLPTLIDRADTYSATRTRPTNQTHREFVYRPAFEMGRHIIGYEVQKILAGVDWFAYDHGESKRPIGVAGYGEGGLLAMHAAAIEPRIDAALVSGYFARREDVWDEPIYRNVFGLLTEFGDAEVASLIAPRNLVIENFSAPEIAGPPEAKPPRTGAAPGRLTKPTLSEVDGEFSRAQRLTSRLPSRPKFNYVAYANASEPFGCVDVLTKFLAALEPSAKLAPLGKPPSDELGKFDSQVRLKRLFDQLVADTQHLMRDSELVRAKFWEKADRKSRSVEKWQETTKDYRQHFYDEVIGRFDRPLLPPDPRTRQIYDEPKYTGYEVVLDVFPNFIASGILLVPKDIKPDERRPVVVCQHGLEGRPTDVANPAVDHPAYHTFACRLAERGFITYAPQNPYIFKDRFRTLQRKANPLGKTLFSIIVPQHQQTVNWLASLPMVDPARIAFYGLSYGGKTAMRVPALVDNYCLSICSADFNEWIDKNASVTAPYTYVHTGEYEIFEWDLANTYNYFEMAGLIAPRPFMVERGHRDGVGLDPQVSYEYAKVRLLYTDLRIPERTTIEYFDGPHTIHGVGTFAFLHEQLKFPVRAE